MIKKVHIEPKGSLSGGIPLPGDKSISHRSLLLSSLASGKSRIRGILASEDVKCTARAVRQMGVHARVRKGELHVAPSDGLREPPDVVDCGNSGTSMRLLAGLVSAQPFHTVLTGDSSLRRRPMLRVVRPLRSMGARIDGREEGARAPLSIRGGDLSMTHHDLDIASAQVKSALMLAGLKSGVAVREPRQSRDHTERMLRHMGARIQGTEDGWMVVLPVDALDPIDIDVPGDLSSAAFFLVAACLVSGSEIYLQRVGVNPTRTGVLDALARMGADIQVYPVQGANSSEPVADLHARFGPLVGATIDGELALRSLDELPVLAVAAAFAEGTTVIADAEELRVKESDRITRVVTGLRSLGVQVEETADGMIIEGGRLRGGGTVDATGDHRIAMAFAVAGLALDGGVHISGADAVTSSYPAFYNHLEQLSG